MKLFLKGLLVYITFATIVLFIVSLASLVFSNRFFPVLLLIIVEITIINRVVYWWELKRILFLE